MNSFTIVIIVILIILLIILNFYEDISTEYRVYSNVIVSSILFCVLGIFGLKHWDKIGGKDELKYTYSKKNYDLIPQLKDYENDLSLLELSKRAPLEYLLKRKNEVVNNNFIFNNGLTLNPNAIPIIKNKLGELDEIGIVNLASNPNAVSIFIPKERMNFYLLGNIGYFERSGVLNSCNTKITALRKFIENPNPETIPIIEKVIQSTKLNDDELIALANNPNAVPIFINHPTLLDKRLYDGMTTVLDYFAENSSREAIPIIKENLSKLSKYGWANLAKNPNVVSIFKEMEISELDNKRIWDDLKYNPSPDVMEFFKSHLSHLEEKRWTGWDALVSNPNFILISDSVLPKLSINGWVDLFKNPNNISIIKNNLDKMIDVESNKIINTRLLNDLASNPNPEVMSILEKYIKDLSEDGEMNLAHNPNFILIVKKNPKILDTNLILRNIFMRKKNPKAFKMLIHHLDELDAKIDELGKKYDELDNDNKTNYNRLVSEKKDILTFLSKNPAVFNDFDYYHADLALGKKDIPSEIRNQIFNFV